jgi:uncharacterized protein
MDGIGGSVSAAADDGVRSLLESLARLDRLLVAFSGGADSAFLLAAAVRSIGPDRVVAATAVSPSLPAVELEQAEHFAALLGVRHELPATDEMSRPGYRANGGDRCYFCKAELLDTLRPLADRLGIEHIATGTNADDAKAGFRPGIRAAAERAALTPLLDAGLSKTAIRAASRQWGLVTWDKPAAACLSSRVAFGIEISPGRLARVEIAETLARQALLRAGLPVGNLRVRDLGEHARIEVDAEYADAAAATDVTDVVAAAGFSSAYVDPSGFRSGSLNELLTEPERFR